VNGKNSHQSRNTSGPFGLDRDPIELNRIGV
jgi:hypothetical protein